MAQSRENYPASLTINNFEVLAYIFSREDEDFHAWELFNERFKGLNTSQKSYFYRFYRQMDEWGYMDRDEHKVNSPKGPGRRYIRINKLGRQVVATATSVMETIVDGVNNRQAVEGYNLPDKALPSWTLKRYMLLHAASVPGGTHLYGLSRTIKEAGREFTGDFTTRVAKPLFDNGILRKQEGVEGSDRGGPPRTCYFTEPQGLRLLELIAPTMEEIISVVRSTDQSSS